MKVSKKTAAALCIIAIFLTLAVPCVLFLLWINQKPNFSQYHSYELKIGFDKDSGKDIYMQLTDEQFQRIVDMYENDENLYYEWRGKSSGVHKYHIYLYKTADMTGEADSMWMCSDDYNFLKIYRSDAFVNYFLLWGSTESWHIEQSTSKQVNAVIKEFIDQYEREQ